jgi:hypothetical protein
MKDIVIIFQVYHFLKMVCKLTTCLVNFWSVWIEVHFVVVRSILYVLNDTVWLTQVICLSSFIVLQLWNCMRMVLQC